MSPKIQFDWDKANQAHIGLHQVLLHEVEEVFQDRYGLILNSYERNDEPRFEILGSTRAGRVLRIVL